MYHNLYSKLFFFFGGMQEHLILMKMLFREVVKITKLKSRNYRIKRTIVGEGIAHRIRGSYSYMYDNYRMNGSPAV